MNAITYRRRAGRVLRFAFILSFLLHFTGAGLYGFLMAHVPRLRELAPHPRPTEMFVTLSDALTLEKRPHLLPRPRPYRRSRARVVAGHHPTSVRAMLRAVPVPVLVSRVTPPPMPHVRPLQPRATRVHPPKLERVALAGPSQLSPTQMERLNADFARTISEARSANDPLRVPKERPAATVKRYHLQIEGRIGSLRVGQGILTPLKRWSADGYTYYYVTYELVWPDGTYESGAVPWPIRYPPSEDPFANGIPGRHIPLPPPLPGWTLPNGIRLGKVLREYFPHYQEPEG
jgi:hypothetical protein